LFFTRGDIFVGKFYRDLLMEGNMMRLQPNGKYRHFREVYDSEEDLKAEKVVRE
jgi:hypothetical protein